jgi:hypothetical protein
MVKKKKKKRIVHTNVRIKENSMTVSMKCSVTAARQIH